MARVENRWLAIVATVAAVAALIVILVWPSEKHHTAAPPATIPYSSTHQKAPPQPRKAVVIAQPRRPAAVVPPVTTQTVTVPASMYSATTTGVRCANGGATTLDQTEWNAFISTHASGWDIKFPLGCYYLADRLRLDTTPLSNVVFESASTPTLSLGNAPQFVQTNLGPGEAPPGPYPNCTADKPILELRGDTTDHVTLKGLIITGNGGNNPYYCGSATPGIWIGSTHAQDGTSFEGPKDITVTNSLIRETIGDGIYQVRSDRVRITLNTFQFAGRDDISQVAGSDTQIDHNKLLQTPGMSYDLETNPYTNNVPLLDGSQRVWVHDNVSTSPNCCRATGQWLNNGNTYSVNAGAYTIVSDVLIDHNTATGALVGGFYNNTIYNGQHGTLTRSAYTNNTSTANSGELRFYGAQTLITVHGNRVTDPTGWVRLTDNNAQTYTTCCPLRVWIGAGGAYPAPCGVVNGNGGIDFTTKRFTAMRTSGINNGGEVYPYSMPPC